MKNLEEWPRDSHDVSKKFHMDKMLKEKVNLLSFQRNEFTLLLRFMSGFSCFAQHMKYVLRLDHDTETQCRYCKKRFELDRSVQVIRNCEFFTSWRFQIFKKQPSILKASK